MIDNVKKLIVIVFFVNIEAKIQIIFSDSPLQSIGSRLYKRELLTNNYNDPKELAYDSATRKLYFMYMDDILQNSGRAFINVVTKESDKILGIQKNKATAVDTENGDVYFGSEDGLYKYDPIENIARNIGLYNINILKIVVRNNDMFLIDANTHMIYKVFNEYRVIIKFGNMKAVMDFDVDNQKNVHYVSICGVYCVTHDHEVVKNKDLDVVHNFIVDGNTTLGIKDDAIYELNCKEGTAVKKGDLDFVPRSIVYGDYGDMYYSIDSYIYRLRPVQSYRIYNIYKKTS